MIYTNLTQHYLEHIAQIRRTRQAMIRTHNTTSPYFVTTPRFEGSLVARTMLGAPNPTRAEVDTRIRLADGRLIEKSELTIYDRIWQKEDD